MRLRNLVCEKDGGNSSIFLSMIKEIERQLSEGNPLRSKKIRRSNFCKEKMIIIF